MPNICLHEANLSWNHVFFSQQPGNFLTQKNVLISNKKDVVQQKSYFTATQIQDFPDLEPLGFLALSYFFLLKKVNRKLTFVYLSETLAQECSKRKVFLKILQNSLENSCVLKSFFKLRCCPTPRSHYARHKYFPVKFAKLLRTLLKTLTTLQNICSSKMLLTNC